MKIRTDFVTNSSSSSFIIDKRKLTDNQIRAIDNHISVAKKLNDRTSRFDFGYVDYEYEWNVFDGGRYIQVSTIMDNFDMETFLYAIGVSSNDIYYYIEDLPLDNPNMDDDLLGELLDED